MSAVVQVSPVQTCKGFGDINELLTIGKETFFFGLKMFTLTLGFELIEIHTRLSSVLFPNVIFLEIDAVFLSYCRTKLGITNKGMNQDNCCYFLTLSIN